MRLLYPHEKRPTVPDTLHGTINQVNKSMFYAVVYAYHSNSDFYLVTEDTAFGDFDDLVIVTTEGAVTAIQYKHERDVAINSTITANDLLVVSKGDYKLHKYYASLEARTPNWASNEGLRLELATNSPLDESLAFCFHADNKEAFLQSNAPYFTLMRGVVIASILKGNNKLTHQPMPQHISVYLDYLSCLLENINVNNYLLTTLLQDIFDIFKQKYQRAPTSVDKTNFIGQCLQGLRSGEQISQEVWSNLSGFLNNNVFSNSGITHWDVIKANLNSERGRVIIFLGKLTLAHSGPDRNETAKNTKSILAERIKVGPEGIDVLYNAFFSYCLEWLARPDVQQLTRDEISQKFYEWQARYLELQKWIGISSAYQESLVTKIGGHQFERPEGIQALSDFELSAKRALVIFGERGMGKSSVICRYIDSKKMMDSDYLFLDTKAIIGILSQIKFDKAYAFKFFHSCKLIVFDNVESIDLVSEAIRNVFIQLISNVPLSVKIVFLFRASRFSISDTLFTIPKENIHMLEMPPLGKDVIISRFPFLYSLSSSSGFTLYARPESQPSFDQFICHPFYLKLLVDFYCKFESLNVNFSSTNNFIDHILQAMLTSSQSSLCRRLIYLISQNRSTRELRNEPEIVNLIGQGILVERDNSYYFSHVLYEEWALRCAIEVRLNSMMESNEEVEFIYQEIFRILPEHQSESCAFLAENISLNAYYLRFKENRQNAVSNHSAVYFLSTLLNKKSHTVLEEHAPIFFILVDIVPIDLLEFLLVISKERALTFFLSPDNQKFYSLFYSVLIRCFCTSEEMIKSGRLFYEILRTLDVGQIKKFDMSYYLEAFFVNALASSHSMGMMSLKTKLAFLRYHCAAITPDSSMEDYCYFQHVYEGLLKAADPGMSGDASYPQHSCFFRSEKSSYLDGYVSYKGKYFSFRGENLEAQASYNCNAMQLLVDCNNRYLINEENLECVDQRHLLEIFKNNIASTTHNLETKHTYIIDVASIVVAKITLDTELLEKLSLLVAEKTKENLEGIQYLHEMRANLFDPVIGERLITAHTKRLQSILSWRHENSYQCYDLTGMNFLLLTATLGENTKNEASLLSLS